VPIANSELHNHKLAYVLTIVISFSYTSINQFPKAKLRKYEKRTRKCFQFSQTIYGQNLTAAVDSPKVSLKWITDPRIHL